VAALEQLCPAITESAFQLYEETSE
jgi:hypothetical protein